MDPKRYIPDSREFEGMSISRRCFWLSRAYIEASACLCEAMLDDEFSSQYSSSRVIVHLTRQGLEPFLKGAILRRTRATSKSGHNLDKLVTEYMELYPGHQFHFNLPTVFSVRESFDLFPESVRAYHATLDQRHRYPADLKGEDFASPERFDAALMLSEIKALSKDLVLIEAKNFGVFEDRLS